MRTRVHAAAICIALSLPASSLADGSDRVGQPLYEVGALYVADALANVHGGLREGSAWVDYLELAAKFDAGRALGIADLTLFASVVRTNPPTFSDRYVGDAMVVSNIDSERALRVLEAWFDWRFEARGAGSVLVGLYDLNSEFDATESRGLFIAARSGWLHPKPGSEPTTGRCRSRLAPTLRVTSGTWNWPGALRSESTSCCNRTCSTW